MKNCLLLVLLVCMNLVVAQDDYIKDQTFNTFQLPQNHYYVDGREISKSIIQPDGKIVLALTNFSSVASTQLIRMDNNELDTSFTSADIDGIVRDMVLQPDGKIVIVGSFTTYDNQPSKYIARLNPDGSIDSSFQVGTGLGTHSFNNNKLAENVRLQSDGKILVCGDLSSYNGTPKNYLIRLHTDGTIDNSFTLDPYWSDRVTAFNIQPDGKIIAAHSSQVIRYNSDGSIDTAFVHNSFPGPSGKQVSTFEFQPDGKILVGGAFNTAAGTSRKDLVRLNVDGTLDPTFGFLGFNGLTGNRDGVKSILLKPNGQMLVGGDFEYAYQNVAMGLLLINADGTVDNSFNGKMGYSPDETLNRVTDLLQHPDGMVLSTGRFHVYNRIAVNNIVKFSHTGDMDTTFHNICEGIDGGVQYLYQDPHGMIIATGDFYSYNGHTRNKIIRLFPNGDIDGSFEAKTEKFIRATYAPFDVKFQPDGKILVSSPGKEFKLPGGGTELGGALVRLNADGSLDTSFVDIDNGDVGFNGFCHSIIIENDGKIIASGNFLKYNGQPVDKIVRLNSDGTLDNTINYAVPFAFIRYAQKTPDNKLMVNGTDTNVYNYSLARLNSDGTIDNTFQISPSILVTKFRVLENGKILVTSHSFMTDHTLTLLNADGSIDNSFTFPSYSINNTDYQIALDIQSDGKIINNVPYQQSPGLIQRYNSNGTLDTDFSVGAGFAYGVGSFTQSTTTRLATLLVLEDGRFLAGGNYRLFDNTPERSLIRLKGANAHYLDDLMLDNDAGLCGAVVNYNFNDFGANAQVVQTEGLPSGSLFPIGLTFNRFEITVGGEVLIRTFYVRVTDTEGPAIACPAQTIVVMADESNTYELPDYIGSGEISVVDNCTNIAGHTQNPVPGTVLGFGTHTITLTATDENGNASTCTFDLNVEEFLSINDQDIINNIQLYPNPVNNVLNMTHSSEISEVVVYDLLGRVMLTKTINSQNATLDLDTLSSGTYILKAKAEGKMQVFRIIKM